MVAVTHAVLSADGGVGLKINDITVVQGQEAAVADAAAATAGAATVTGVALTDSTGGTASGADTLVDETATYSMALGEANVATLAVAIEQSRVDIAAAKVEFDKLITDVGLVRVALNLVIGRLEGHGLLAS